MLCYIHLITWKCILNLITSTELLKAINYCDH